MGHPDLAPDERFRSILEAFDELGQRVRAVGPEQTPDAIVEVAAGHVPGARDVSMSLLRQGHFSTIATTSEVAEQSDLLQYRLASGPCVDAIVEDTVLRSDDLAADGRWPVYGPRVVAEHGVRSMLSYRLDVDSEDLIAGLNLYSSEPAAFGDAAVDLGALLAVHAATSLSAALNKQRADHLERALASNRDIGVAMGVLMSQHGLSRQQAFDLLRLASQRSNRKLRDLAAEVALTGTLDLHGEDHTSRRPAPPREG